MSAADFRVAVSEPAVGQPELAVIVELARALRVPTVRIDTQSLIAAVAKQRTARIRWASAGAVLAIAAASLLWMAIDRRAWLQGTEATRDEAPRVLDGSRGGGEVRAAEPGGTAGERATSVAPEDPVEPPQPTPAAGAAPSDEPSTDDGTKPTEPVLDADELARRAEKAMAARRGDEAIALLTTLVRRFPRAPAAKAALLDLGRLLRDDGRPDEARCAYRLLVARWPSEAKAPEITRVLASLGDGPECRGLKPQR